MAANSCDEGKAYFPGIKDGKSDLTISCVCIQLLKPSFDEVNHSLFTGCSLISISVLPDEGNTSPKCTSQLTFLSFIDLSEIRMSMDVQLDCQICFDVQMKRADAYSSCIVDIHIEKESLEIIKSNDETVSSMKSNGIVTMAYSTCRRCRRDKLA